MISYNPGDVVTIRDQAGEEVKATVRVCTPSGNGTHTLILRFPADDVQSDKAAQESRRKQEVEEAAKRGFEG